MIVEMTYQQTNIYHNNEYTMPIFIPMAHLWVIVYEYQKQNVQYDEVYHNDRPHNTSIRSCVICHNPI